LPREPVPDELRRFILTSIHSVPFVEAILLFMGQAGLALDVPTVARRLYVSEASATELTASLVAAGIVEPVEGAATPSWRFSPQRDLQRMLHLLAAYYSSHLIEVTDLIHSTGARKAQRFADAFVLRKDKEGS
jgi:hypothetical protein